MNNGNRNWLQSFVRSPRGRLCNKYGLDDAAVRRLKAEAENHLQCDASDEIAASFHESMLMLRRDQHADRQYASKIADAWQDLACTHSDNHKQEPDGNDACSNLVDRSIDRFVPPAQLKCLRAITVGHRKAEYARKAKISASRVSQLHQRARDWSLAGAIVIACEERSQDAADAILSHSFEEYSPFCHEVLSRFEIIASDPESYRTRKNNLDSGLVWLWERAFQRIEQVVLTDTTDPRKLKSISPSAFVLLLAARFGKSKYDGLFREMWRRAERSGLAKHPVIRRQLVELGSYCGCDDHQIQFLRDPISQDVEPLSVMSYLDRPKQWSLSMLRNGDMNECLARLRADCSGPVESLASLASSLLSNGNFKMNEGQAFMVLQWIRRICDYVEATQMPADSLTKLGHDLERYAWKVRLSRDSVRLHQKVLDAACRRSGK